MSMVPMQAAQVAPDGRYAAVIDVLARFYDALYRGDVEVLRSVLHGEAHYYTATGGELLHMDMAAYFDAVAARTTPQNRGDAYDFTIEAIEFAGPVTASARMRSTMFDKSFVDFLTLVELDGRWQIVAKVFHYDLIEAAVADRQGA